MVYTSSAEPVWAWLEIGTFVTKELERQSSDVNPISEVELLMRPGYRRRHFLGKGFSNVYRGLIRW